MSHTFKFFRAGGFDQMRAAELLADPGVLA